MKLKKSQPLYWDRTGHFWTQHSINGLIRAEGGSNQLTQPADHTIPHAPQDIIGFSGHKDSASSWSTCHPTRPPGPSLQSSSPAGEPPSLCWYVGLFLLRCRTQHLPLSNPIRFLHTQLSSLSRSSWMNPSSYTLFYWILIYLWGHVWASCNGVLLKWSYSVPCVSHSVPASVPTAP